MGIRHFVWDLSTPSPWFKNGFNARLSRIAETTHGIDFSESVVRHSLRYDFQAGSVLLSRIKFKFSRNRLADVFTGPDNTLWLVLFRTAQIALVAWPEKLNTVRTGKLRLRCF